MYTINSNQLEILVKGRPITEYNHRGLTYVEGRKGSEYVIRYRNNTSVRKKIVVSVDGLNVISGNVNWKMGYVVDPWATVDIPGWRKDNNNVAKFKFSSVKKSYNQHNDYGDEQNVGVIGVKVFHEQPNFTWSYLPPLEIKQVYHHYHYDNHWPYYWTGTPYYGITGGVPVASSASINNTLHDGHNVTMTMNAGKDSASIFQCAAVAPEPQQSIGTSYGKNKEFKTTEAHYTFNESASDTLLIYYDSREGLEYRGINVHRHVERRRPDAFPTYGGVGCPPPK